MSFSIFGQTNVEVIPEEMGMLISNNLVFGPTTPMSHKRISWSEWMSYWTQQTVGYHWVLLGTTNNIRYILQENLAIMQIQPWRICTKGRETSKRRLGGASLQVELEGINWIIASGTSYFDYRWFSMAGVYLKLRPNTLNPTQNTNPFNQFLPRLAVAVTQKLFVQNGGNFRNRWPKAAPRNKLLASILQHLGFHVQPLASRVFLDDGQTPRRGLDMAGIWWDDVRVLDFDQLLHSVRVGVQQDCDTPLQMWCCLNRYLKVLKVIIISLQLLVTPDFVGFNLLSLSLLIALLSSSNRRLPTPPVHTHMCLGLSVRCCLTQWAPVFLWILGCS